MKLLETRLCPNCVKPTLKLNEIDPAKAYCTQCWWKGPLKLALKWDKK